MAITISFNQDTGSISVEDYNFKKIERHKGKSLLDFPKNYIVIDIETTGLDTSIDSIIEIGAIKVVNNSVESTFSSLVKPPALEFDPEFDEYSRRNRDLFDEALVRNIIILILISLT